GSGLFFAITVMLLRKQRHGSPIESVILRHALGFLVCIPFVWSAPHLSDGSLITLLSFRVVQLGLAYLIYVQASKQVTALEAVLIPVLEPILNPIWVFFYFTEKPSALTLAGGLLVVGAVTWRAVSSIRQQRSA